MPARQPSQGDHVLTITPDQMSSAASYLTREMGDGYRIDGIESPTRAVSAFHAVAPDGSRFTILTDRWGNRRIVNTHHVQGAERTAYIAPAVAALHAEAVRP